jgi:hypothetical protein
MQPKRNPNANQSAADAIQPGRRVHPDDSYAWSVPARAAWPPAWRTKGPMGNLPRAWGGFHTVAISHSASVSRRRRNRPLQASVNYRSGWWQPKPRTARLIPQILLGERFACAVCWFPPRRTQPRGYGCGLSDDRRLPQTTGSAGATRHGPARCGGKMTTLKVAFKRNLLRCKMLCTASPISLRLRGGGVRRLVLRSRRTGPIRRRGIGPVLLSSLSSADGTESTTIAEFPHRRASRGLRFAAFWRAAP